MVADLDHPVSTAVCVHRWRIGAPHGESCLGTCSLCGTVRSFTNERRPFGQPTKNRRPAPPVPPVLLARLAASPAGPGLLSISDGSHRELHAE